MFTPIHLLPRFNTERLVSYQRRWEKEGGSLRVLAVLSLLIVVGTAIFWPRVGFRDALMLTAGAFFTFGAYADRIKTLPIGYELWHIVEAFLGMILAALYVTVWANVWLRER